MRLFRSSLCYLGYPPHSCLSYLPYSLYLRLLFNGKYSTRNRNFPFIDMRQVATIKVDKYVSFFGNERVSTLIQLISSLVLSSLFPIQSFLRVNIPSSGLILLLGSSKSIFRFLSKLACTNFEAALLRTAPRCQIRRRET